MTLSTTSPLVSRNFLDVTSASCSQGILIVRKSARILRPSSEILLRYSGPTTVPPIAPAASPAILSGSNPPQPG